MTPIADQFQDDIVARLATEPFFNDVTVIQERKADAASQVKRALGGELRAPSGKFGAFVIVEMPTRTPDEIEVMVLARCVPKFMPTGVDAHNFVWEMSDRIEDLFDAWSNGALTVAVRRVVPYSEEGVIGYDAQLVWRRAIARTDLTRTPSSAVKADLVTLWSETPDAAIYYTTDGGYPAAGVAGATLYTAPFAKPASGTLLRAAAYSADLLGSGLLRKRLP